MITPEWSLITYPIPEGPRLPLEAPSKFNFNQPGFGGVRVTSFLELWIRLIYLQVRDGLRENNELEEEERELRICVFNVPKELLVMKTEAYIPQSVSIGPYHQWRPELYEMESSGFANGVGRLLCSRVLAILCEAGGQNKPLLSAEAEERLCNLLTLACKELLPFMFKMPETSKLQIKDRRHILEVLYYSLVSVAPKVDSFRSAVEMEEQPLPDRTNVQKALNLPWKALSALNVRPIERIFQGRVVQFVIKLPLRLVSALGNLPVLRVLKGPILVIFNSFSAEKTDRDGTGEDDSYVEIPPTRDELDIASISSLYSAGLKFLPTDGDLTTIRFDQKTATLYFPKVKLDANSEVVLRNLVAFEASASPGAFIFTRYTDLMNGMIDSAEDVRLLRTSGIIYNYLESDGKAASMWNGMGKCVKLTKVKQLDEVIAEVNKFYSRKWSVAVEKCLKTYVFDSWKFLTLSAALILLALTCLQAFCSAYDCKKWFSDTDFTDDSERLSKKFL
ncbi:putative UPF0481 protein At3g02645 [Cryptomeria japonica]|uniref:putative UPF0481 protein At3g02645 n=1 Tax=Cryptomeria japonica TaxID=3369 RepID=UPI0027DA5895|nr:putative UPF0481 protein At3g02645 [Cryptomeria japonica]